MKIAFKRFFVILILLSVGKLLPAQDTNFSTSTTVGITTPILDNGSGFHIGVNPAYSVSPRFSLEGQVSYLYTKINGSFISGNQGKSNAVNTLVGGRLYLSSEERPNRLYINLLVGGNYNNEEIDGRANGGEFSGGFSVGGYVAFRKILLGLSYDTPQNLILKVGYVFE
ncbi:MAG: hypothetical protein AB8G22_10540 [Saprospiraceae bacterium]